jgi:hypothetical protein
MRSLHSVLLNTYIYDDEISVNDMGGACSTHTGEQICISSFLGKMKGRDRLYKICVERSIILKWTSRTYNGKIGLDLSRRGE